MDAEPGDPRRTASLPKTRFVSDRRKSSEWFSGGPSLFSLEGTLALFFGRHRYRSDNTLLDGACFRPIGQSKPDFLDALKTLGLPLIRPTKKEKLAFEFRNVWNQMRWGGRKRRRHWKREQHE